ncbi:hypothetical protein [Staphylococcus kloosii]|uniref:hypothetical protein n=1 Tax=Staphylococcus kloosii TaxID=29384 RepID=UPI0028A36789|nr:hypothetical protein [Staphylococcus kloosii]MDT3958723.1 hypothetical protein [Staphylococcus kloosii]
MMNKNLYIKIMIFIIFLVLSIVGLVIGQHIKDEKSTDLSSFEIDGITVGDQFQQSGYEKNNKIKLDRFTFYNKVNHPNIVVKIAKKSKDVIGITLTEDQGIKTIDHLHINDSFKVLKRKLGCNFTERKVGKGYKLILYVDKTHHIKLSVVIKNEKIKKFEFYKQ